MNYLYKKIHIYYDGAYICTTNSQTTCKEAKQYFINNPVWQGLKKNKIGQCKLENVNPQKVKASFK